MIVYITISRCSFVFSQSRVQVSNSLTDVSGLAVGEIDLVNSSLSVVRFVLRRCSNRCRVSVRLGRFSSSVNVSFNKVGVVVVIVKNTFNVIELT